MDFRPIFILLNLIFTSQSLNILGVFPAPGYSQFILGEVLMIEAAKRGHEVTVISPYKPKNEPKNYRTILTKEVLNIGKDRNYFDGAFKNLFSKIVGTYGFGTKITEQTLKDEKVQELLHSTNHFDVVIVEAFFNDAMKGFAAHFKAPLITFSSMSLAQWNKEFLGIPSFSSFNAVTYTGYTNQMDFSKRFINLLGTVYDYLYRHFVYFPDQRKLFKENFPELNFDDVVYNSSLMFVNTHVTTAESTLAPYNVIDIGGFHVVPGKLNSEMESFLNNATEGVILFSLGSNLNSSQLSQSLQESLFRVFSKLKHKVLWKFESDDLPNKPNNVFISKWLNQKDILAHSNVKLFITHGGLLGTTEAIVHGVPMLGIPVFADQSINMARAQSIGIAQVIHFSEFSEERFSRVVNEMLHDPSYGINAKKIASIMNDRPTAALDLAMYWIEYVARHQGLYFQLSSAKLYWFQVYSLDILFVLIIAIYLVAKIFAFFTNCYKDIRKSKNKYKTH